jgi:stage V sporulation protein G
MEITEVRMFLREGGNRKLKAYATITFDNAFVVRNIKVIEGNKGLFVAMPSRKLREACPKCNFKNAVRSKFCNQCGANLPVMERRPRAEEGGKEQQSEHRDIAHPVTLECREYIQKKVLDAYEAEKRQPSSQRPSRPAPSAEAPRPEAKTPKQEEPPAQEDTTEGGDIEL